MYCARLPTRVITQRAMSFPRYVMTSRKISCKKTTIRRSGNDNSKLLDDAGCFVDKDPIVLLDKLSCENIPMFALNGDWIASLPEDQRTTFLLGLQSMGYFQINDGSNGTMLIAKEEAMQQIDDYMNELSSNTTE